MKRPMKKFLTTVLAAAMAAGVLTGCGGDPEDSGATGSGANGQSGGGTGHQSEGMVPQ